MHFSAGEDYYALLGVSTGANAAALRAAWRRLARRWHPDAAGAAATATFQKLSTAYEVLCDPVKRAAYDRQRRATQPMEPPVAATEHRAPVQAAAPAIGLSRISGPLTSLLACGVAAIEDDGLITLRLTPGDAAQGGMATISMHVDVRCGTCAAGAPSRGCARCGGSGFVDELYAAWLSVPPGVSDGQLLTPSVDLPGMLEPVRFRVCISRPRR